MQLRFLRPCRVRGGVAWWFPWGAPEPRVMGSWAAAWWFWLPLPPLAVLGCLRPVCGGLAVGGGGAAWWLAESNRKEKLGMDRVLLFIKNFWCFLWHWSVLVIPVHFLLPDKPSWLSADWYALLAGYEWGVPLTVFGFISFVMTSQYVEFNRFPLVSLFRGKGLTESLNTGIEDFLNGLTEVDSDADSESQLEKRGISDKTTEDPKGDAFKVLPPSL